MKLREAKGVPPYTCAEPSREPSQARPTCVVRGELDFICHSIVGWSHQTDSYGTMDRKLRE